MHVQYIGRVRVAAAILALSLAPLAPAHAAPAPVTVKIDNFTFTPQVITVSVGTTVTWVNDDDTPHTVVADDHKSFRSKPLDTDDQFSFTFTTAGSFGYFCSIHPHMTGKVVVKPN
ncbi:MAG TPA: cupredoxin family copper-binding protein [Caulobacteraceae bacterium]|jgi:plastocyanin|nr:cupredoxin family copper-binding protein [Caulobacteraceae bacterium]